MKKSLFAVLALLLTCSSIGFAQDVVVIESRTGYNAYDFDFVGGGTRSKGMGNAHLGVSDDINGGSWNPAGLFEIDETVIGLSWFKLTPRGFTSAQQNTDPVDLDHFGSFSDLSSFNFVSPMRVSGHPFVFSLNLNRNFNSFSQAGFERVDTFFNTSNISGRVFSDTNEVSTSQVVSQEGGMNALNIGFGTRFYDKVSFGATVNIYTGKSLVHIDENSFGLGFRFNGFQFATFEQETELQDTNKFSGTNITLGFMYNGEKMDAGIVIKTPFSLKENRIQTVATVRYVRADSAIARSISEDGSGTTYTTDILFKYEMPLMIGAGFGYHATDNLLLAGDIEYRGFKGKNIDYRISQTINPGGSNFEEYVTIDPKWNNSLSLRFGAEYMKSFGFGIVPLRAGLSYVPSPNSDTEDNKTRLSISNPFESAVDFLANGKNIYASLGTGIHWGQIKFDLAYAYTKSDISSSNQSSANFFGDLNNFVSVASENKNHVVSFSFTGVF